MLKDTLQKNSASHVMNPQVTNIINSQIMPWAKEYKDRRIEDVIIIGTDKSASGLEGIISYPNEVRTFSHGDSYYTAYVICKGADQTARDVIRESSMLYPLSHAYLLGDVNG